jgi:hypothetical protein
VTRLWRGVRRELATLIGRLEKGRTAGLAGFRQIKYAQPYHLGGRIRPESPEKGVKTVKKIVKAP